MRCPARGLHLPEQSKCWHSPCRKRDGLNAAGLLSGMPHPWRKDGSFRESETAKSHRCSPSPGSEKGQLRLSFNAVLHKGLRTSQPHPMPQAEPCCSPASSGSCPASAAQRGEQEPLCSKQKGKHMDYRHTRKQSPSSVHISTKSSTKHRMLLSNSRFKSTKLRADSCLIHASPKGQHSSTAARRRRLSEIR